MTDPPGSLAAALADLQMNLPPIGKDAQAQYGRYADLADVTKAIMPELGKRGLSFSCAPTEGPDEQGNVRFHLFYMLRHVSGDGISGRYPLPASGSPQAIGSAITYARRYALCAVTGAVADEDDDGQAAEKAATPAKRGRPPARPAAELPRNTDGSVSRSRTTDEELANSGQMTDAQLRAHNKQARDTQASDKKADRLTETPADDPWYAESPPAVRQPRPALDPARQIILHLARLGFPGDQWRDARLQVTAQLAGRGPITSTSDLTAAEGLAVLAKLGVCKDRAALDKLLEEVPA